MAATMQDVARLAGVSLKTVSNVVNDYPHIRPTTRQRVEDAIAKLGYEVNVTARNLRRGSTGLIGLALPELKLPYFAELADSVIAEAEKRGLQVIIQQTNSERAREIDALHGQRRFMTDGLIFSPLALGQDDVHLFKVDFPLVLLGERVFGSTNDHITMSNVEGAEAATAHLLSLGRRRIAVIGAHTGEQVGSGPLRLRGYRQALERAGVPYDPALVREGGLWHRRTGADAMEELIASGIAFDAVFALNDALAIGALHALRAHQIAVPERVALVGFDDIDESEYTYPPLTSVSPGRQEIAEAAVALLQQRIAETNQPVESTRPFRRIYAGFELKVRQSSDASAATTPA